MAIKLNNFVDININYNTTRNANYTRETAVLIINGPGKLEGSTYVDTDETYKSLDEVINYFSDDDRFDPEGNLRYYAEEFFNNGGAKLRIIQKVTEIDEDNPDYIKSTSTYFEDKKYFDKSHDEVTPTSLNLYTEGSTSAVAYEIPNEFKDGIFYKITETDVTSSISSDDDLAKDTYYTKDGTSYKEATKYVSGTSYYSLDINETTPVKNNLYIAVPSYASIPLRSLIEMVEGLDNEYIVICSNQSFETMKNLNDKINKPENPQDNIKGIESKLFITCVDADVYDDIPRETPQETKKHAIPKITSTYNGLIIKYGKLGCEMTIAAYLTNFNVFATNSVNDYDFTLEEINYQYTVSGNTVNTVEGILVDDDTIAKKLMLANINFNGTLVNETRAIGGNDIRGNDFVNEFMLIVLHQTLTEQLVLLLTNKIKYNSTGLSLIGATISRELQKYVNNGYLTTDKIWDDEDLVYNGITIITKNTPLKIGYKYVVMPFATLSDEDRKNHKLPTIYILIADSYSIRKIEIEGTVF